MSKDLNRFTATGRLGKDTELKVTPNGKSVATFSVASSRNVKDGDDWKEVTEWVRCVAWDKLAETCGSYLRKGSKVYVEGRLQTRDYQDKDGVKRYSTEVVLQDMIMLDSKADSEARQAAGVGAGASGNDFDDDDSSGIPF